MIRKARLFPLWISLNLYICLAIGLKFLANFKADNNYFRDFIESKNRYHIKPLAYTRLNMYCWFVLVLQMIFLCWLFLLLQKYQFTRGPMTVSNGNIKKIRFVYSHSHSSLIFVLCLYTVCTVEHDRSILSPLYSMYCVV